MQFFYSKYFIQFIVTVLLSLSFSQTTLSAADQKKWQFVRDGVLHIKKNDESKDKILNIEWNSAWIPNSQLEILYWLSPTGDLISQPEIPHTSKSGSLSLPFNAQQGEYFIEVPGASYRFYSLRHPIDYPAVFSPAKVHQSAAVEKGASLYFKVPANQSFKLNGKYYGGVRGLIIAPMNHTQVKPTELTLKKHKEYSQFNQLSVPPLNRDTLWKLTFKGTGKVSFWLDDIPNYFSQTPQDYFVPSWKTGSVATAVENDVLGSTPKIGAALTHSAIPPRSFKLLKSLNMQSSNYYFFDDVLKKNLKMDSPYMKAYEERLGIKEGITIRAETNRRPVISSKKVSAQLLEKYLKNHRQNGRLKNTYIAIADEPNLNYPSLQRFLDDYIYIADQIKKHSNPTISQTKFAAPQSSRFVNGPTRSQSDRRLGTAWLLSLLEKRPDLVDAISWHEWLVRDLIATSWYHRSIGEAHSIRQQYPNTDGSLKPLIISQTNISSGKSLSPYEQETFFAALWWSSVVIQSARSGQLAQLVWFKAADDGKYNKGMISQKRQQYFLKPVGEAQVFLQDKLGDQVLKTSHQSVELDVLVTRDSASGEIKVFGVNKSERNYKLNLEFPSPLPQRSATLMTEEGIQNKALEFIGNSVRLDLPSQSIFAF